MFSKPKLLSQHFRACVSNFKAENIRDVTQVIFSRTKVASRCLSDFVASNSFLDNNHASKIREFDQDGKNEIKSNKLQ